MSARQSNIRALIKQVFAEMSGIPASNIDEQVSFLELGADSLLLVHASQAIEDAFQLKVPFRYLMEENPSIASLAAYIDERMPADETPSPTAAPPAMPTTPAPVWPPVVTPPIDPSAGELERIIQQQLAIMAEQLTLLRGVPLPPATALTTATTDTTSAAPSDLIPSDTAPREAFVPYKKISGQATTQLSPPQQSALDALSQRHTRRTAKSKTLSLTHRAALSDSRTVTGFNPLWKEMVYPLAVQRGAAGKIWDVDENEYVDIAMGFGALLFGHSPTFITQSLHEQAERGLQLGMESPWVGPAAEIVCELTGMQRATFCNSGTEAVMTALRLARTVTGRDRIALFAGAYHGFADVVMARSGRVGTGNEPRTAPLAPGVPQSVTGDVVVLDYASEAAWDYLHSHAHELAAILVEPVQSRRPDLQPVEFLRALRQLTDTTETALIFDEVITGFRVHPAGVQGLFGIQADLATYGKAAAGGLAAGIIAGSARYMDAIDGGYWQYGDASYPQAERTFYAGTFFAHPLTMAPVWATLNHIKQHSPDLQARLNARTAYLANRLNQVFTARNWPVEVVHFGSLFRFVFGREIKHADLFFYYMQEQGIFVRSTGNCFLSTAHTDTEIEQIISASIAAVEQLATGGFLSTPPSSAPATYPMAPAQQALWVQTQLSTAALCAYNESLTLDLRGPLNLNALQRAWRTVVARHDSLRTTFSADGTQQIVASPGPTCLPLIDMSAEPEKLAAWVRTEARRPFDLTQGPLWRATVAQLAPDHHALVVTLHHLVTDGWSNAVLIEELAGLYSAETQARPPHLPEPMPYRDFLAWQATQDPRTAAAYWGQQLSGELPILELPTDRPRPAVQTYLGDIAHLTLEADLVRRLTQLGAQQGCTLFVTLLAGFKTLLYRLTGQSDLIVGVASAGQPLVGDANLIGYGVNLIPLRSQPHGGQTFADYLRTLRQVVIDGFEHQPYPFTQLLKQLNPPRDPSRPPLVSVVFNMDRKPPQGPPLGGLEAGVIPNHAGGAKYDLTLNLTQTGQQLEVDVEYNTALFDADTVARWLAHWRVLLAQAAEQPQTSLAALRWLTPADEEQVLRTWNATQATYPPELIHERIAAQAQRTPEATALVYAGESLTYAALNRRANQLAHYLRRQGVGPESLVGVCMERAPEMVIALLAILKAGGAYTPLDPTYPAERLTFMLADADVRLTLTQARWRHLLAGAQVVCVDEMGEELGRESAENPSVPLSETNLAYMIYTSGSTGRPKGALNTHAGLRNRLCWMQEAYPLTTADAVLQKTPFTFDVSVWEFFWPLMVGARLVVARPDGQRDPLYLAELIRQQQITTLHFVPSMLQPFLDQAQVGACRGLKRVVCSGEALPWALQQRFFEKLPGAALYNLYGPTEAAVDVTAWPCQPETTGRGVPIGRPIANTQTYVLDAHLRPTPVGVPGELYLGGVQVGRGYHRRAALSAEKFIPDPFSTQPGARLYRTGDRARFRPDGNLEFLGRLDFQVKLRGVRIELGEIDAALAEHPAVREAVTIVRPMGQAAGNSEASDDPHQLVSYIVPHAAPAANQEAQHLAGWQTFTDAAYQLYAAAQPARSDPAAVLVRWNDIYTGAPLPEEEVREQVNHTVARLRALQPRHLLEIGCGVGMLLFRLAPLTQRYIATDFSAMALETVRRGLAQPPYNTWPVQLHHGPADDLTPFAGHSFDTIILNSVIQYFPSQAYLLRVLDGLFPLAAPGGAIYLGDLRSLPLLDALHTAVQWPKSDARLTGAQLAQRVREQIANETELAVDPVFFAALKARYPRLSNIQIELKRGHYHNELTRFRYDVTLRLDAPPTSPPMTWQDWGEAGLTLETLPAHLAMGDRLGLRHIPNARLLAETRAVRWLAENGAQPVAALRPLWDAWETQGVEPEALIALGEAAGYHVTLTWSVQPGAMDAIFTPAALMGVSADILPAGWSDTPAEDWSIYTNHPARLDTRAGLVDAVKQYMRRRLPPAMIPAAVVVLDALPLSPNGKVDRKALPAPGRTHLVGDSPRQAGRNTAEDTLLHIWQRVLNLPEISIHDNFFALGGDSILGLQVIGHAVRAGLNLTPPQIFQYQTVAELAAIAIEAGSTSSATATGSPGGHVSSTGSPATTYPLAPIQTGILFHSLRQPTADMYFVQFQATLEGELDKAAFRHAWRQLLGRHAALRVSFQWEGLDEPQQHVAPTCPLPWQELDWHGQPDLAAQLEAFLNDDRARPFDLTQPPLWRLALAQTAVGQHYLILSFHHLILDGWSLSLLMQELLDLYAVHIGVGLQSTLPSSTPTYAEYVAWQRSQDLTDSAALWQEALKGCIAPTPLSIGRRTQGEVAPHYDQQEAHFTPEETATLHAWARGQRLTLNTVVQGAWAIVLSRYSRTQDVIFGATVAGRASGPPDVAQMIGLFINTLPVRALVAPSAHLGPWLQELQAQQARLRQNEHVPLYDIQAWSGVRPGQALFESILVFENVPRSVAAPAGAGLRLGDGQLRAHTNYPLTLAVDPDEALRLLVVYEEERFEAAAIARLLGHIRSVLLGMAAAGPTACLDDLPMLTAPEQAQLQAWNATEQAYGEDRPIHALISAQAARTPYAIALAFEDQLMRYAELEQRANQLAYYLQAQGVGPETLVGVAMERSTTLVIALLAILKAGGAYLPLDLSYPAARLAFMLEDARPLLLLTQTHLLERLSNGLASLLNQPVCVDNLLETLADAPQSPPAVTLHPASAAYMIYTSGSTGRPKGVVNTHEALRNRLLWMQADLQLTPADRVLQKTPFSFDVSVWEFFWPLMVGARLVVARPEGHKDPHYLAQIISAQAITTVHFVPSMLQAWLDSADVIPCHTLQRLICSGEALPPGLVKRCYARLPEAVVYNLYGPTEAAIDVTWWTCSPDAGNEITPIGHPIANTEIVILDPQFRPVPVGIAGELAIGGVQLARGYHGRRGLSAEKFIPHPFSAQPGARLYRTGDLARYREDGAVEYLGRIDFQIKLHGFRIELGEIENALSRHPAVREALVILREDAPGAPQLVAYVTLRSDRPASAANLTFDEMRAFLQTSLPSAMIPSALIHLEAFPLSPNGKVDRRLLPAPSGERPELQQSYVAPRSAAEQSIAAIWREVLGVDRVGVHDHFFDLGGNSIRVMQVHSRLSQVFERSIALVELFKYPTVAELARYLTQPVSAADTVGAARARAAERRAALGQRGQSRPGG